MSIAAPPSATDVLREAPTLPGGPAFALCPGTAPDQPERSDTRFQRAPPGPGEPSARAHAGERTHLSTRTHRGRRLQRPKNCQLQRQVLARAEAPH
jgi:hypothetical protein